MPLRLKYMNGWPSAVSLASNSILPSESVSPAVGDKTSSHACLTWCHFRIAGSCNDVRIGCAQRWTLNSKCTSDRRSFRACCNMLASIAVCEPNYLCFTVTIGFTIGFFNVAPVSVRSTLLVPEYWLLTLLAATREVALFITVANRLVSGPMVPNVSAL